MSILMQSLSGTLPIIVPTKQDCQKPSLTNWMAEIFQENCIQKPADYFLREVFIVRRTPRLILTYSRSAPRFNIPIEGV